MALVITTDCINCDMCMPECPNDAIYIGKQCYQIDTTLCSECEGFYNEPQCIPVCPIDCIVRAPA